MAATKLTLANGSFSVLNNGDSVSSAYTDYAGTTRSSSCSRLDLVLFAMRILDEFAPDGDLKILVGR